jgi:hypothetical protein
METRMTMENHGPRIVTVPEERNNADDAATAAATADYGTRWDNRVDRTPREVPLCPKSVPSYHHHNISKEALDAVQRDHQTSPHPAAPPYTPRSGSVKNIMLETPTTASRLARDAETRQREAYSAREREYE